jgi:hypothetical protein
MAAVADYRRREVSDSKLKKTEGDIVLPLSFKTAAHECGGGRGPRRPR